VVGSRGRRVEEIVGHAEVGRDEQEGRDGSEGGEDLVEVVGELPLGDGPGFLKGMEKEKEREKEGDGRK
jgi:hypothetical protein